MITETVYITLKRIAFGLMLLLGITSAQFETAPYEFKEKLYLEHQHVFEGFLFDKNVPNLISFDVAGTGNKREIKFSMGDYSFIDNILVPADSNKILPQLSIYDFDKDSLDEIVIPIMYDNRIDFYLYNFNVDNSFKNAPFFSIFGTNNSKSFNLSYTYANLDDDSEMEIIIGYCENYPEVGTIRGVYAVDISSGKLLWFHPTASYFLTFSVLEFSKPPISTIVATSGVSNGVSFSNDTFFIRDKSGDAVPYKTHYTNVNSNKIDTTTSDYSGDIYSSIFALDKNGNKVWEEILGGEYVWTKATKVDDKTVLLGQTHRSEQDGNFGRAVLIDINTGVIINQVNFSKRARDIDAAKGRLLVNYTDNSSNVYTGDLSPLLPQDLLNTNLDKYFISETGNFYTGKTQKNLTGYEVLFNENGDVKAAIQSDTRLNYFPKLKQFYIQQPEGAYLLELAYVPWYQRISANTLWIIVISIAGLVILLLALWGMTMHYASKQIQQQKIEIEQTTAKLIESEKLALLGTIAGSLAHELNSPLGAIKNSIQRLGKSNLPEDEVKQNYNLINSAVNNSAILIQKFFKKTHKEDSQPYSDLKSVLDEWKLLFKRQFELLDISIIENIETNLKTAIAPSELNQVFNNLFTNARDALLETDTIDKQIIFCAKEIDNFIEISVQDNGNGFDQNILKSALEPFKTTKEIGKGTGLGLWIVKQIVESKGGGISLKNIDGGAIVKIKIPVYREKDERQV